MPAPLGNNNGHRVNTWPAEHDAALKEYFAEGMSSSQVADALNTRFGWRTNYTRNAVIGRRIRMGIKSANPHPKGRKVAKAAAPRPWEAAGISKRQYQRRLAASRGVTLPPQPLPVSIRCDAPVSRNLALVDLEAGDCRWPHGDSPFTFCGSARAGIAYCMYHDALATGRP